MFKTFSSFVQLWGAQRATKRLQAKQQHLMICLLHSDGVGVHRLLKDGLDPNFNPNTLKFISPLSNLPPLFAAVYCKNSEILKLLLQYGANPHMMFLNPLSISGEPENIMEFLLQRAEDFEPIQSFQNEDDVIEKYVEMYKILRRHIEINDALKQYMQTTKAKTVSRLWECEFKNRLKSELTDYDCPNPPRRKM